MKSAGPVFWPFFYGAAPTYAFTLMLATFLCGITVGLCLFERRHRRWRLNNNLLGCLLLLLALGGLLFLATQKSGRADPVAGHRRRRIRRSLLGGQFLVAFLAMLCRPPVPPYLPPDRVPPREISHRRGAFTSQPYAANTLGAILETDVAGLFPDQMAERRECPSCCASGLLTPAATVPADPWRQRQRHQQPTAAGLLLLAIMAASGTARAFLIDPHCGPARSSLAPRGEIAPLAFLDLLMGLEKLVNCAKRPRRHGKRGRAGKAMSARTPM